LAYRFHLKKEDAMATRIVKLCLIRGFTEAYYHLSEDERQALFDNVGAGLERVGARMVGP
jgi:hypothetical protein